jgi:hypothetical protein
LSVSDESAKAFLSERIASYMTTASEPSVAVSSAAKDGESVAT